MPNSAGRLAAATRTRKNWLGRRSTVSLHRLGFSKKSNIRVRYLPQTNPSAAARPKNLSLLQQHHAVVRLAPARKHKVAVVPNVLRLNLLTHAAHQLNHAAHQPNRAAVKRDRLLIPIHARRELF